MRGLLALWVLAFHVLVIVGGWHWIPGRLQPAFDGARAVDAFIILSGFVIAGLIVDSRESYPVYIARRFARLYPVFLVCLGLALSAQAAGWMPRRPAEGDLSPHILAHSLMLHGAVPSWMLPQASGAILNPAWSVSLEWQFYLVAPLLLMGRTLTQRFIAATVICLVGYRLVAPQLVGFDGAFLPMRLHYFWVGIASALAWRAGARTREFLIALVAAAMLLPLTQNAGLFVWLAAMALIARSPSLKVPPWLLLLGAISYPLYLCHETVIWGAAHLIAGDGAWRVLLVGGISLVVSLGIAAALHVAIERPCIDWARAYAGRGRQAFIRDQPTTLG